MTITNKVQGAYFENEAKDTDLKLIRLAPNAPPSKGPTRRQGKAWTPDEHERFCAAMEKYPSGPWKRIAAEVGTRNTRQTMTHAQKYRQKIARWKRTNQAQTSPRTHFSTKNTQEDNTGNPPNDDLLDDAAGFWRSIVVLEVDLSDEEQQPLVELEITALDEGELLPEQLVALLKDYEPLQLTQDMEMAQIDERLAQLL
jgi:SHAQKYF class myb-like DNA-binding protein